MLQVGGLRDGHGRWYNERGTLYALVHQFRRTRHSAFYASLEQSFPARAAGTDDAECAARGLRVPSIAPIDVAIDLAIALMLPSTLPLL